MFWHSRICSKKMIIVHLSGGLGNQLFQYAAGRSLSLHHNTALRLDDSFYRKDYLRQCELSYFEMPLSFATAAELQPYAKRNLLVKITDRLQPAHQRSIYKEPHYHYDPSFFHAPATCYLKGYWQSARYFNRYSDVIRNDLTIKRQYVADVLDYASKLAAENSVSLHIRRGDYLDQTTREYHGVLSMTYYQNAINLVANRIPDARFYIFSDDMEWVQRYLTIEQPCEYLSTQVTKSAIEDFFLMSRCRHNIIANSSFSWWAGWLNPNPEKLVIAPQQWFNKAHLDTRDLIPETWLRL